MALTGEALGDAGVAEAVAGESSVSGVKTGWLGGATGGLCAGFAVSAAGVAAVTAVLLRGLTVLLFFVFKGDFSGDFLATLSGRRGLCQGAEK